MKCAKFRIPSVFNLFLLAVAAMACTACVSAFGVAAKDIDKQLTSQPMVIYAETGEHRINHKSGFVINMKPEEADKINAPNSQEFFKLLRIQLSMQEEKNGYRFCKDGYKIVDSYTYYFVIISAECD